MKLSNIIYNWKTVIAYILMNVPGLTDYPMLKAAIEAVIAVPSWHNILAFAIQLLLATGVIHRIDKLLRGEA